MAAIFYYEDEEVWRKRYVPVIEANGHRVDSYTRNVEAESAIRTSITDAPDVAVLDIQDQLRHKNVGFRILKELRRRWPALPVIFLTSYEHGSVEEMKAIQLRANYYINKTRDSSGLFLLAAVEAALESGGSPQLDRYQCGSLASDQGTQSILWKGRDVPLTRTEFLIVDFLVRRVGTKQPFEKIRRASQIQEASDRDIDFTTPEEREQQKQEKLRNTLSQHVSAIRRKFERVEKEIQLDAGVGEDTYRKIFGNILVTEYGFGYMWRKDT